MIEQTELVVTCWDYHPPSGGVADTEHIPSSISLEVQKKRASNKKGIACRFSCRFHLHDKTILQYVGEDSYVIDLADEIDKNELLRMVRNSYSKFVEKFEFRKMNTVLYNRPLKPLDESLIDLDAILPLLK